MDAQELIIVIPAYEPDMELAVLIDKLNTFFTGHKLVVVDDGSNDKSIFSEVEKKDNVHLIHHEVNCGKGAALKTAFKYIKSLEGSHVIVTADSDGQHKPEDIYRVYNFYKKYNYGLVLGSRKFDCDIPARSSFGNNCTSFLLRSTQGIKLNDTQTGLRAFGTELLDFLLEIKGNRYEYEMNMIALASQSHVEIHEIAIETIYIDNNASSHFRPVRDFTRICSVILKYTLPLILSLILFIGGFFLAKKLLWSVIDNRDYLLLASLGASGLVAMLFGMVIHASGFLFGNKYLFKTKKKFLYYLFGSLVFVLVLVGACFGYYKLIRNIYGGMAMGIVVTMLILWFQLYFCARRSELFEE